MLTRRGLFSALVGAVAAVFGVKAASKLALHPKAFSRTMAPLVTDPDTGIAMRFVTEFTHPVVGMTMVGRRVYEDGEVHHGEVIRVVPPTRFVED